MSMESVTTVLHGVTRPSSEPEQEPKLTSEIHDPMSKKFNSTAQYCGSYFYDSYFNRSPYDAIPRPRQFGGGNPISPLFITERDRPFLKNLSQLALDYYNNKEGSGEILEFVDLVKCAFWHDFCANPSFHYVVEKPAEYYITFEAKAKGDDSAITVFQAKVLVDEVDKDKPHVVQECRIKTQYTPPCESCPS